MVPGLGKVPLVKLTPTEVEGCPRSCAGLVTTVTTLPPWGDGRSASAPAQRAGLPEGGSRITGRARSELLTKEQRVMRLLELPICVDRWRSWVAGTASR